MFTLSLPLWAIFWIVSAVLLALLLTIPIKNRVLDIIGGLCLCVSLVISAGYSFVVLIAFCVLYDVRKMPQEWQQVYHVLDNTFDQNIEEHYVQSFIDKYKDTNSISLIPYSSSDAILNRCQSSTAANLIRPFIDKPKLPELPIPEKLERKSSD